MLEETKYSRYALGDTQRYVPSRYAVPRTNEFHLRDFPESALNDSPERHAWEFLCFLMLHLHHIAPLA